MRLVKGGRRLAILWPLLQTDRNPGRAGAARAQLLAKARHWMNGVKDYCRSRGKLIFRSDFSRKQAAPGGAGSKSAAQLRGEERHRPEIVHPHRDCTSPSEARRALSPQQQAALGRRDENKVEGYSVLEGLKSASGGFGAVASVVKGDWGEIDVRKTAHEGATDPAKNERAQKYLDEESRLLAQLDHPNIVKNKGGFPSPVAKGRRDAGSPRHLIMSDGGHDLRTLITPRSRGARTKSVADYPLSVGRIRETLRQLGEALDYLHNTKRVVHCDIKPENILIKQDGHITLCDFGVAVPSYDSPDAHYKSATPHMMAPELIRALMGEREVFRVRDRLPALDCWSLGCTLYEVAFGRRLFNFAEWKKDGGLLAKQSNRAGLEKKIDRKLKKMRDARKRGRGLGLSPEQETQLKTLLMGLLEYDPAKRMTISEMRKHPFLAEGGAAQKLAQDKN